MRRVPIVSTIVVAAAVATMIALGVWQLQRLDEKQAMLSRYAVAMAEGSTVAFPGDDAAAVEQALFHRSEVDCQSISGPWNSIAGRNSKGESGYVHLANCQIGDRRSAPVQAGWTKGPQHPDWSGGRVSGLIAPYTDGAARLIADPPAPGFAASARPDPADVPNNHLAYAVQWFFFAIVALMIYGLALRKRWQERA
ncbi:MAG: threonine synthase [Novosphingobium sp. 16-62-11]|uniref:SURF1 family protein n=1 Tax=Novosphingobium sp. 17-62-19 TaxID=1970406 RepID=UPI000BC6EE9E|nr:SURF1 family protein [Novosphingobium sp. 17-62-19]OYX93390.1 MAG: threonine synthase [Novosphingobium sp. 35-62-5]OYZ43806.1 MAG: threonine synthase [Novosphingobium sp. 16-62-11]OZA20928.1 MAG: threonine synthase [Novosphingobium sp. 17-62-19]HQS97448.1 SURF1 family protein [Novosphingobium sp.]